MTDIAKLKVNLPERLEGASFFTRDPFPIFEMCNFVNEEFYFQLVADVGKRQEFDRVFAAKGNKKKLSLGGHNIAQAEQSPFKTFVEYFLSEHFFDWFVRTHLPYFQDGQPQYVYDKTSEDFKAMKAASKAAKNPISYYNVEVHYSSIGPGGFIPPHTDAARKRLSFVYYLPASQLESVMQEKLGTQFYDVKAGKTAWQEFNSGLLNERKTEKFHEDHEIAKTATFEMNKAVGFIKSDVSWHSVLPNRYDYDRRAIVINILEV